MVATILIILVKIYLPNFVQYYNRDNVDNTSVVTIEIVNSI